MGVIKTNIDEAIARVDDWKGKSITYAPVPGGITNPNFKVNVNGKNFFLKIPGAGTDFIDRDNCHAANRIASDTGTGPKVCYYFPDTGVEIFEWLEGYRTMNFGDIYDERIFTRAFEAIASFHNVEGGKLPLTQSLFEQARDMKERAKAGGYMPPWEDRMEYLLNAIEAAMIRHGMELRPCHNDFWSNNIMINDETGDVKVIDWEYASMNDPYADLGPMSGTNYFTEAMDERLCTVYHGGKFDEIGFAKIKLYKIVAEIKWSYWVLQQAVNSDVDYDYYNWYGIKMARIQHFWQYPRVDMWINLLNGTPAFKTGK